MDAKMVIVCDYMLFQQFSYLSSNYSQEWFVWADITILTPWRPLYCNPLIPLFSSLDQSNKTEKFNTCVCHLRQFFSPFFNICVCLGTYFVYNGHFGLFLTNDHNLRAKCSWNFISLFVPFFFRFSYLSLIPPSLWNQCFFSNYLSLIS